MTSVAKLRAAFAHAANPQPSSSKSSSRPQKSPSQSSEKASSSTSKPDAKSSGLDMMNIFSRKSQAQDKLKGKTKGLEQTKFILGFLSSLGDGGACVPGLKSATGLAVQIIETAQVNHLPRFPFLYIRFTFFFRPS
jgi:hypothetical protein